MKIDLKKLVVFFDLNQSIDKVYKELGRSSKKVKYPGIGIILDKDKILRGIVTDGDLRRAYSRNVDFKLPITHIMTEKPITVHYLTPQELIVNNLKEEVLKIKKRKTNLVRHIILIDDSKKVRNVLDLFEVLLTQGDRFKNVCVLGLGFVGLTLAVTLSNIGHKVTGIDIDKNYLKNLKNKNISIHEPGLKEIFAKNLDKGQLKLSDKIKDSLSDIYVIAVGTPLNKANEPELKHLKQVTKHISKFLKIGDHVMLRSTIPVETTRLIIIPILEKLSKLKAGKDFNISFTPERVVEGDALKELRELPQIVGGYTQQCTKKSADFWSNVTPLVIRTPSLEASELVKLANNSFRDLSFAFANELAFLSQKFNINAFDLIKAANDGYPRNKIPLPSPGVGGYCLTKDPILLGSSICGTRNDILLNKVGRIVNERATKSIINLIKNFAKQIDKPINNLNVFIIGIAFKGEPETNDTRGSISIDMLRLLEKKVKNVYGWDHVVKSKELKRNGFKIVKNLDEGIKISDIILLLNNNRFNINSKFFYKSYKDYKLIFDGWNQLNQKEIENTKLNTYATLGYVEKK